MPARASSQDVDAKILTGLSRLSVALRSDSWSRSFKESLNPTQLQVLSYMAASGRPATVGELARQLGATKATLSDSVQVLCEKKLVHKAPSAEDRRSSSLRLTRAGLETAGRLAGWSSGLLEGFRFLGAEEKGQLLLLISKLIRGLQEAGRIAPARLCLGCVYFAPDRHPGSRKPHHCNFVDAPLGGSDLRLDCRDFAAAA